MASIKETIIDIAKKSVESYAKGEALSIDCRGLDDYLKNKRACFVCLKIDNNLRGCMGSIKPECRTLAEEIANNAVTSAFKDPRFRPVSAGELPYIKYSVDVISPMELTDKTNLDPKKYGVMVKSNFKVGVLLPDLDGVNTVKEQLRVAKLKAGITKGEDTEIFRFTAERYE